MKRKTIALMTAVTLSVSLSACGDKTALQAEIPDTTSVEETAETTEEAEVTEEESTKEEETIPEITQEEKVQSALGEMPYYGDTSKCAMTAEQATAYAQLIADGLAGDFSFRGGYDEEIYNIMTWSEPFHINQVDAYINEYETDRTKVMLGDFSCNGVPYIYISSSVEPSSFEVYGWKENRAVLISSGEKYLRENFELSEQNDGTVRFVEQASNTEVYCGEEIFWAAVLWEESDFTEGSLKQVSERALAKPDPLDSSGIFSIIENGEKTGECPDEEYEAFLEKEAHQHTLPYTCFYDMTPCTLEEMVNYLNAYATAMSDGQSVPVEIKKVDIVKHDGTGIITKGEVSQEKVNSLEILRQYINDERTLPIGDDYGTSYGYEGEKFYFGLNDLNNDGKQELLLSYKDGNWNSTTVDLGSESMANIKGVNQSDRTYLGKISNDGYSITSLYFYDGTTFSVKELYGSWSEGGEEYYGGTLTENGTTREIGEEEFNRISNDWESKHIDEHTDFGANTHLDIENIENTFQVKIDVQSSGEWLVTNAE